MQEQKTGGIPSVTPLRDKLREVGIARLRKYKSPLLIGGGIRRVYQYYFRARMAAWIMDDAIEKHYPDHPEGPKASAAINDVVNTDITRVTIDLAAAAWLTIDHWRLHVVFPEIEIPSDLSYGLVLQYPQPMLRQAQFLVGQTVEEELKALDPHLLRESEGFALRQVQKVYRDQTNRVIEAEIQLIENLGFVAPE